MTETIPPDPVEEGQQPPDPLPEPAPVVPDVITELPIVFLSPASIAGQTGIQRMNGRMEVIAILLADGTDASHTGCSYEGQ